MAAVVKRKCQIPLQFRSLDFHVTENATRHITKQYEQTKKLCRPRRRSSAARRASAQQPRDSAPLDPAQKIDSAPHEEGVSDSQHFANRSQISGDAQPRSSAPPGAEPRESTQEGGAVDMSQHSAKLEGSQLSALYGSARELKTSADGRDAGFDHYRSIYATERSLIG